MDDQSPTLVAPHRLIDVLGQLTAASDMNARWEASVAIARDLGADALNVVRFHEGNPMPVWFRVSTHERGGMEEYVARNYMSVDPVLVRWWDGSMKDIDHISLHQDLAGRALSDLARECYDHLLRHGQSDYITFRLRDSEDDSQQILVVFSCSAAVAAEFKANIDQLAIVANLFGVYIGPPTPAQPTGKVPLLYDFLTPREKDVLSCLARGMHNEAIAHHLGISEVTVRMHTTSARKKMGASTRAQAIALALVRNLISA